MHNHCEVRVIDSLLTAQHSGIAHPAAWVSLVWLTTLKSIAPEQVVDSELQLLNSLGSSTCQEAQLQTSWPTFSPSHRQQPSLLYSTSLYLPAALLLAAAVSRAPDLRPSFSQSAPSQEGTEQALTRCGFRCLQDTKRACIWPELHHLVEDVANLDRPAYRTDVVS